MNKEDLNFGISNQLSNQSSQTTSIMNQKRFQFLGEMKKSKREEIFRKRRNIMFKESSEATEKESASQNITKNQNYEKLLEDLVGNDQDSYTALIVFRQLSDTNIDEIINFSKLFDLVFVLFSKLNQSFPEEIQLEASKIIVNISATEQGGKFKTLIEEKIVDTTIYAFKNCATSVFEQILVCLGNTVGENEILRDNILERGMLEELIIYANNQNSRAGSWAICNLFRGNSLPLKYVEIGIPFLLKNCSKFSNLEEKSISEECLWSLVEFSENEQNSSYFLQKFDDLIPICSILESHESILVTPFLKFLSNILIQNKNACNYFMKNGLLNQFIKLLSLKNLTIKLEVLTMLSAIVSDNTEGVDFIIEIGDLIPKIIYLIKADHKEVQKQGCWVICKIIKASTSKQLGQLYQLQVFATLCELLDESDNRILMMALDCIHDFLEAGSQALDDDGENFFVLALNQLGAINKIVDLQDSPYEMIIKKSVFILENYFEVDED